MSVLLASVLLVPSAGAATGEPEAKIAALEFGRSLTGADASNLRSVLPRRGKVRLHLVRFGPEAGSYSPDQVGALFTDFFRQGAVRSYDLLRVQCASGQHALVHAKVRLIDRDGRPADVDLHLTFQGEDERWVLREIRESPP